MTLLQFICDTLCIDKVELVRFSYTCPHRYKIYKIPKRNSKGLRTIAHPSKELKFIQKIIISYLSDKLPVHKCAYAYKLGISIKENAMVHLNTKYLLKMDFTNFFPSITPVLFFSALEKSGLEFDDSDKFLLRNFLFCRFDRSAPLKLSIGAPSSPLISNFIMFWFDEELESMCDKKEINYTRYADDLTFSTRVKNILFDVPDIVIKSLETNTEGHIKINESKTVFASKAHNRHVTGVTLSNDDVLSIGRERKRLISSMIHKFVNNLLDEENVLELHGLLSFASHIEPDFYKRMCKKYGESSLEKLKKFHK